MGDQIDIRSRVICPRQFRVLALERDPFTIRRNIVVRRVTEGRIRTLEVLDTGDKILQGPIEGVVSIGPLTRIYPLQHAREDSIESGRQPLVPVPDIDAVVDTGRAQRSRS